MSNLVEFTLDTLPSELNEVPAREREAHRELVVRNIDILIDLLSGECVRSNRRLPVGCPTATPECLSRRRSTGDDEKFPCSLRQLKGTTDRIPASGCCTDPLAGSDDPLDTVAAVCLATSGKSPAERYQDHYWRKLIAELRHEIGDWETISGMGKQGLVDQLSTLSGDRGFRAERGSRLYSLLDELKESDRIEGVSLSNLPGRKYEQIVEFLANLSGISEGDAWWLLLTAFEKPVWPSSPQTDALLCSLGVISPKQYCNTDPRRREIEKTFSDRRLPVLHRLLSSHALHSRGDVCGENCPIRKFLLPHRVRKQSADSNPSKPIAVDLFAGAGGFSAGLQVAGIEIGYAVDRSVEATDTYRLNHPSIPHSAIRTEDIEETVESGFFEDIEEDVDIVVGGPPCQALSLAGYRSRLANDEDYSVLEDPRATLYQSYIDVLHQLDPDIVVMENVRGMVSEIGDSGIKVADLVLEGLSEAGYEAKVKISDFSEFGLPQRRKRAIILGVQNDGTESGGSEELFQNLYEKKRKTTPNIRQALTGLPRLKRGEGGSVVPRETPGPRSEFFHDANLKGDPGFVYNHRAREHPKPEDRRLFDEIMEPGMDSGDVVHDTEHGDLIDYDIGTEDNPRFVDKYRMLDWAEPSPTIVAHLQKDANNFILPDYHRYYSYSASDPCRQRNRGVTPREAARIQSFSDDFLFLGSFTDWFQQIGNAVPPFIGKLIGETVREASQGSSPTVKVENNPKLEVESDD